MTHAPATGNEALEGSSLYNEDLAPVPPERRTWKMWNFAALWISMAACIPTYMLASSLIGNGMNWSQAIFTIFLGNVIVLIPMVLNAHAGTRYGIPFPVYCRAAFGTLGANVPALLRALVACGWFGIQAWIGGNAIYQILAVFISSLAKSAPIGARTSLPQLLCFLFFGINMGSTRASTIRRCSASGAALIVLGLALLWWATIALWTILSQPSAFGRKEAPAVLSVFVPSLQAYRFWASCH